MCDEHTPINFSLSKDTDTGAITIRYSSPENLPIRFFWETQVDIDGTSAITPMVIERN